MLLDFFLDLIRKHFFQAVVNSFLICEFPPLNKSNIFAQIEEISFVISKLGMVSKKSYLKLSVRKTTLIFKETKKIRFIEVVILKKCVIF